MAHQRLVTHSSKRPGLQQWDAMYLLPDFVGFAGLLRHGQLRTMPQLMIPLRQTSKQTTSVPCYLLDHERRLLILLRPAHVHGERSRRFCEGRDRLQNPVAEPLPKTEQRREAAPLLVRRCGRSQTCRQRTDVHKFVYRNHMTNEASQARLVVASA